MLSQERLMNIMDVLTLANRSGMAGHFVESGAWRGGGSIFARMFQKNFLNPNSLTIACDSFAGFPRPRSSQTAFGADANHHANPLRFANSVENVRQSFADYGLLDPQVHLFKGFFNDSMPRVRKFLLEVPDRKISVLRLDGDMYDSTVDVLYVLYDLVEVGGWVIIDDWEFSARMMSKFGAPAAVLDFWVMHGLDTDHVFYPASFESGIFWQKKRDVRVQRELLSSGKTHPDPAPDYASLAAKLIRRKSLPTKSLL